MEKWFRHYATVAGISHRKDGEEGYIFNKFKIDPNSAKSSPQDVVKRWRLDIVVV